MRRRPTPCPMRSRGRPGGRAALGPPAAVHPLVGLPDRPRLLALVLPRRPPLELPHRGDIEVLVPKGAPMPTGHSQEAPATPHHIPHSKPVPATTCSNRRRASALRNEG